MGLPLADDAAAESNARALVHVNSREDWLDLALVALDQAGLSLEEQQRIWDLVGRTGED